MNKEIVKSATIGLLALAALVAWLEFQPRLPDVAPKEKIGRKLFENFDDPARMRRVEFERIDAKTGELRQLTLVRDGEIWRLPDLTNFPAENAERLAKIVAPLTQLTVLDVADEATRGGDEKKIETFHRECGVVDPATAVDADDACDAIDVKIEGENGERLVDLIVGNRAPESSATRDVRYVRVAGDDLVYVVDFSGDSTEETGTTQFEEFPRRISFEPIDWIDRDLLRIGRWDVATLTVRDYRFERKKSSDGATETLALRSPGVAVFRQTPENSLSRVWSLVRRWNGSDPDASGDVAWNEVATIDPESAQNDVLNETADALAQLKIADVRKKPDILATLFRENRLGAELSNPATIATLAEFGFAQYPVDPLDPTKIEPTLIGEEGELDLIMKNGIKITLLFGKKIDEKRVCLAFAKFDRAALAESVDDENELAFLAKEAENKAKIKNDRFADWFYSIAEEDFQKLRFRFSDVLK